METEGGPLDTSDFEEAARTYLRDMKVVSCPFEKCWFAAAVAVVTQA